MTSRTEYDGEHVERLRAFVGAYIAFDLHIGGHVCGYADGSCRIGVELQYRYLEALLELTENDRRVCLAEMRDWIQARERTDGGS